MTRRVTAIKQKRNYINLQLTADEAGIKQGIIKQKSNTSYALTKSLDERLLFTSDAHSRLKKHYCCTQIRKQTWLFHGFPKRIIAEISLFHGWGEKNMNFLTLASTYCKYKLIMLRYRVHNLYISWKIKHKEWRSENAHTAQSPHVRHSVFSYLKTRKTCQRSTFWTRHMYSTPSTTHAWSFFARANIRRVTLEIRTETQINIRAKCSLSLSTFEKNWDMSTNFSKLSNRVLTQWNIELKSQIIQTLNTKSTIININMGHSWAYWDSN